jgi:hypothetical protein
MSPARREQIKREALPKIHYRHDRPTIRSQHIAPAAKEMPADQAAGSDERDESNQDVVLGRSSSPLYLYATRRLHRAT